jgi:hypothetical protein
MGVFGIDTFREPSLVPPDEYCDVCGKPCDDHDNDGNCVHDLCAADRDAMQSREDR